MPEIQLTEENRYVFVEALARNGMTLQQCADVFGVNVETVRNWIHTDCRFEEAWMRGRVHPDHLVEQALFRRAVGYQIEEVVQEKNLTGQVVKEKRTVREIAPSEIACFFWLKNRLPHLWQDRVQHDVTFRDLMDIGDKHKHLTDKPMLTDDSGTIEAEFSEITSE
jgi:hypothetical protein